MTTTYVCHKGWAGDVPLVGREQEDVRARGVHLVTLSRMDGLLLHSLDLQGLHLLIEDLTQIHDHTLVYLLPQVSTEDLNQTNLQRRNFTVPSIRSQTTSQQEIGQAHMKIPVRSSCTWKPT